MDLDIRVATTSDASSVLAIYAPYCEATSVTFEIAPPTEAQMQERIVNVTANYPWFVAEVQGRIVGYVYAGRFRERAGYRWTAEVAVYIAPDMHRRGLGRALYTSLFSILRAQGYAKLIAGITVPNPASVRLHESLGFVQTGMFPGVGYKDGKWLDVGWWQLQLRPEGVNPPEPQPFSSLADPAVLDAAIAQGKALLSG